MKARPVKGIKPDGWLAENARRIVLVRLDELLSFGEDARDPAKVRELHDMRIAAKRLRYVLEIHEPLFGPAAARAARTVRDLQELLGEIHDCDEMLPMVRRHRRALRREDAEAIRAAAETGADDLEPAAAQATRHGDLYRGLEALIAYVSARREVLHARFVRRWDELERHDFTGKLEWDIERASGKAMTAVAARERREEAEREAADLAAQIERQAAELERQAAEEATRLERELQEREAAVGVPGGRIANGAGGRSSGNGQPAGRDATTGPKGAGNIDGIAADETTSGSGEGNSLN
jgi:hypothetical protein